MKVSKRAKSKLTCSQVTGEGKIVNVRYLQLIRMYFKMCPKLGSIS